MTAEIEDITVVELSVWDVDLVRELWGELLAYHHQTAPELARTGAALTVEESWPKRRAEYVDWFRSAAGRLFTAQINGRPVGYCFVRLGPASNSWDWGSIGILETLVVRGDSRGHGVGTRLFNSALQYLGGVGAQTLKISVVTANKAAIDFYRRLGARDHLLTLASPIHPIPPSSKEIP